MKRLAPLAVAILAAFVLVAPLSSQEITYHLVGDPEVYTLVNLHPDGWRLSSVNYLRAGLIPLCTKVRIESVDSREMVVRVAETDQGYIYEFHRSLRVPIPQHLDRMFGKSCDKKKIETMSEVDREGILQGKVSPGMSKAAVLLAIGYPPEHRTPGLEANAWRYWKGRTDTILVHFEDDKVVRIQE